MTVVRKLVRTKNAPWLARAWLSLVLVGAKRRCLEQLKKCLFIALQHEMMAKLSGVKTWARNTILLRPSLPMDLPDPDLSTLETTVLETPSSKLLIPQPDSIHDYIDDAVLVARDKGPSRVEYSKRYRPISQDAVPYGSRLSLP
jgi:hypothetical protein